MGEMEVGVAFSNGEDFPVMGDSRLCRVVTLLPLLPFLLLHVVLHQSNHPELM